MKEDLKNIILMGLGAMSLTNDKAHELKDELLKRGKDAYEKGRVANEELKHNIEDKIKENVTVVYQTNDLTNEELAAKIKNMSAEDKKEILNLLKNKKENNGSQKTEWYYSYN